MRATQRSFWSRRTGHGGQLRRGKRKEARPIATKCAMHVTMRAEKARGRWSLLTKRNAQFVERMLATTGQRWGVKIYERANVGNHLHLLLKARTREGFSNFLRVLGAQIALFVTGATRAKRLGERFWDLPAWSRLVETDFPEVRAYVVQNRLEAEGVIPYEPRRSALASPTRPRPGRIGTLIQ